MPSRARDGALGVISVVSSGCCWRASKHLALLCSLSEARVVVSPRSDGGLVGAQLLRALVETPLQLDVNGLAGTEGAGSLCSERPKAKERKLSETGSPPVQLLSSSSALPKKLVFVGLRDQMRPGNSSEQSDREAEPQPTSPRSADGCSKVQWRVTQAFTPSQ